MKYDQDYHKEAHQYLYKSPEYYQLRAKLAFDRYFKKIKDIKSKKILEYGVGMGQNIFFLRNNSLGYDLSKFALDFSSSKGIKTINDEKKIKNNEFDIVISSHVLEHLDNPLENLKLLNNKLKKEGLLIIVLPRETHGKVSYSPDMRNYHLYSWNLRTINNLLDKSGFKVVYNKEIFGTGYYKLSPISNLSFGLYKMITRLAGRLFRSGEMVIIARKK